ncbi:MAG: ATP-binding protein [Thermodesulfobacteriota bacterium]
MPVSEEPWHRGPVTGKLWQGLRRRVGQAMHRYRMLADGDRVLVAVSGGVDSLFLVWLLAAWRAKAPIDYHLAAVHLDMGFEPATGPAVRQRLAGQGVPFSVIDTDFGARAAAEEARSACFHCARRRRNRLFEIARQEGCNKIAFGHHAGDLIETFFLNLFYSGNLSTMVPRQDLFGGRLAIIRPLAFLDKAAITAAAGELSLDAVANPCPLAATSRRAGIRLLLDGLTRDNPRLKANILAGLANVRPDYLLAPR